MTFSGYLLQTRVVLYLVALCGTWWQLDERVQCQQQWRSQQQLDHERRGSRPSLIPETAKPSSESENSANGKEGTNDLRGYPVNKRFDENRRTPKRVHGKALCVSFISCLQPKQLNNA